MTAPDAKSKKPEMKYGLARDWAEHVRSTVVLGYGIALTTLGASSIGLQFAGISLLSYYSTIAPGIWGGFVYVLTGALLVSLVCHRKQNLIYGIMGMAVLTMVLAVCLFGVFVAGACKDSKYPEEHSWGCSNGLSDHCMHYMKSRSDMIAVQVILVIVNLGAFGIGIAAFVETLRIFVPRCRHCNPFTACCRTETVIFTDKEKISSEEIEEHLSKVKPKARKNIVIKVKKHKKVEKPPVVVQQEQAPRRDRKPDPVVIDPEMLKRQLGYANNPDVEVAAKPIVIQGNGSNIDYSMVMIDGVPTLVNSAANTIDKQTRTPKYNHTANRPVKQTNEQQRIHVPVGEGEGHELIMDFDGQGNLVVVNDGSGGAPPRTHNGDLTTDERVNDIMNQLRSQYDSQDIMEPVVIER